MPWHSTVETDLTCPSCGRQSEAPAGLIAFHWGAVPEEYRRKGPIQWITVRGEKVRSFHLVGTLDRLRYNFGDPQLKHLIAFDADPNLDTYACSRCRVEFEMIGVEIRDNVIVQGVAFLPGECLRRFGRSPESLPVVEIAGDGAIVLHDEWADHPFTGP